MIFSGCLAAAPLPPPPPPPPPTPIILEEPEIPAPTKKILLPAFPWPPHPASAETTLPHHWLVRGQETTLADVANRLEGALKAARYPKWSYSFVPNGFALVSRMEQISSDGTSSPEPARWSADLPSIAHMTFFEFVRALAKAPPAHYRAIVFIVTDQPWSRTGARPTGDAAERWLAQGYNRLPKSIGDIRYTAHYKTTALVYEFKKVSKDADAVLVDPSPTSADDHLDKAGIQNPLSR